jgi:hypothetical protein
MNIKELLKEYGLGIDDIRWFLAGRFAEKLLSYKDTPAELTRMIWSGSIENELYNMEEIYIEELQDDLNRDFRDEARIREILNEVNTAKRLRK